MSPQCRTPGMAIAVVTVFLLPAFSQTTTTTTTAPPTSTTGTTSTGTNPTRGTTIPSSDGTTNNNNNNVPRLQRPVFVSGRVMVDDGTPAPSIAVIESICNGNTHAEGYTDGKGYFSLQLGQQRSEVIDASEGSSGLARSFPQGSGSPTTDGMTPGMSSGRGMGPDNRFANCELRARLGGYRSQSINLVNRGAMDNPDVGVILIHRMGQSDEGTTVTATTLKAPKAARKAMQKGTDLLKKNKTEEALASFQEAVRLYPEFATAWCALGRLQAADGSHLTEARESFTNAAKFEPRWPEPLLELSKLAAQSRNWKELNELTGHVLRLDSFDYPQAYLLNAVANYYLRHVEVAEKSARAAQRLDVQHQYPQISHLLGTILAEHKQYAAAADELRSYLVLSPRATDAAVVRKQLADVEKLAMESPEVARKEPR